MGVRKRENDRIERENHAFAKRLFSNPAMIKKKEMDQSYELYVKNRTRISKAHKLSPLRLTSIPGFNLSSSKLLGSVKQGSKTNIQTQEPFVEEQGPIQAIETTVNQDNSVSINPETDGKQEEA